MTIPGRRAWTASAAVYALFLVCAAPIGLLTGLLRPSMPHLPPAQMIRVAFLIFLQPALVEEIVFRALLIPREAGAMPRRRLILVAGAALAVYVASHPLNAWLFRPQVLAVFASPAYLVLATLLGAACTAAYLVSRSIWPSVVIHWLTVVTWLWFLGGQALLC